MLSINNMNNCTLNVYNNNVLNKCFKMSIKVIALQTAINKDSSADRKTKMGLNNRGVQNYVYY